MKKCLYTLIAVCALNAAVLSQSATDTTSCPTGLVCISPEAARKALEAQDALDAERKLSAAKDQAITDALKINADLKIELARIMGEKSQMEQDRVRWTAVIDILIKNSRKKSIGLIAF